MCYIVYTREDGGFVGAGREPGRRWVGRLHAHLHGCQCRDGEKRLPDGAAAAFPLC